MVYNVLIQTFYPKRITATNTSALNRRFDRYSIVIFMSNSIVQHFSVKWSVNGVLSAVKLQVINIVVHEIRSSKQPN